MNDLTPSQWQILERLTEAGAATLTDLAVRMRTMPEQIEADVQILREKKLAETAPFTSGLTMRYLSDIYRVTDKGRRLLALRAQLA